MGFNDSNAVFTMPVAPTAYGNGGFGGFGGDGGRSYHSVNDRIVANLERELDYAQSEFERKRIMDEIRRIREMKD